MIESSNDDDIDVNFTKLHHSDAHNDKINAVTANNAVRIARCALYVCMVCLV